MKRKEVFLISKLTELLVILLLTLGLTITLTALHFVVLWWWYNLCAPALDEGYDEDDPQADGTFGFVAGKEIEIQENTEEMEWDEDTY